MAAPPLEPSPSPAQCPSLLVCNQSLDLLVGKHFVQVLYMQHGGTAPQLKVEYSATALSIPTTTLDTAQMVYGGRGPSFLTYPDILGSVNSRIKNTYPTLGSGYVAQYTVNPPLPTGLTLDPTTGLISGTPSVCLLPSLHF